MRKPWMILASLLAVGVVLTVWAQSQFSLTQSIYINSTDNFPALRAVKSNQSNPWIEFATTGSPVFQVTADASILTSGTNHGSLAATGWTNLTGDDCFAVFTNSAAVTNIDAAGVAWLTNAASSTYVTVPVLAGGILKAPSGLSGVYHSQ